MKNTMKILLIFSIWTLGNCYPQDDDREDMISDYHPLKNCRTNIPGLLPQKATFENLDEKLFTGLTNMDCLDMKSRGIHQIAIGFFKKFPNLRAVNLAKNSLDVNLFFQNQDLGNIESLNLDENKRIETLKIVGIYPKLKHLYLRNLGLKNLDVLFTSSLTHLHLSNNAFSQGSLKISALVTHLFLDNNNLAKISDVSSNLRLLSLNDNVFEKIGCTQKVHISSLCLEKFPQLEQLLIATNNLFEIEANAFEKNEKLGELDVSGNNIDELNENSLGKLNNLRKLNLSSNPLREVPKVCVLKNLELLTLDHTRIIGIVDNGFCELKKLKALWLNDVGIERIGENSFGNLIALEELHLGENRLRTLDGWQMPFSLRRLYLEGNSFKCLADATRIGTAFLEYLDLRRNQINDSEVRSFNISKLHIDY